MEWANRTRSDRIRPRFEFKPDPNPKRTVSRSRHDATTRAAGIPGGSPPSLPSSLNGQNLAYMRRVNNNNNNIINNNNLPADLMVFHNFFHTVFFPRLFSKIAAPRGDGHLPPPLRFSRSVSEGVGRGGMGPSRPGQAGRSGTGRSRGVVLESSSWPGPARPCPVSPRSRLNLCVETNTPLKITVTIGKGAAAKGPQRPAHSQPRVGPSRRVTLRNSA